MKMNLGIPPGFHSEEPNTPKFVQTSLSFFLKAHK